MSYARWLDRALRHSVRTVASPTVSDFHRAWAMAKEHPELCTDGYDKSAFMYVQFWLEQVKRQKAEA